jgi:subtilisin-like proprotein convertase family protein
VGDHIVAVLVTNQCGSASNSAILTIGVSTTASALTNATRCVCESVTFSTEVSGGPARFVWKANGHVLEGETTSTLILQNLKDANAGIYTVEVDGPCNRVTNSATLTLEGSVLNPVSFTNAATILFNDLSAGSPYPSVINVKCIPGLVSRLRVTLNKIGHSFPDDMDVLLVSPSGQKLKLMSDVGGNRANGVSGVVLTFDDSASNPLGDTNMLVSGIYRPTDFEPNDNFGPPVPTGPYLTNLFGFSGSDPNGTWSLFVADDLRGDTGQITEGWKLHLEWDPAQPRLSAPVLRPDGVFQMTVSSGLTGQTHAIEASTDLQTWMPLGTVSGTNSNFIDPQALNYSHRFYRAVRCR